MSRENVDHSKCVPLCNATEAYGEERVKLRHHSPFCPVRQEAEKV